MSNFIQKCEKGEVLLEEVDDFIDAWHEGKSNMLLHEFLGMTKAEYNLWVVDPNVLPYIVTAHLKNRNVSELLDSLHSLPIAARSTDPEKARTLMHWLKSQGLWEKTRQRK